MKKSTSTKGSEQSLEYLEVLSTSVIYFRLLKIIKEQGQNSNNVTTSLKESQKILLSDRHTAQRYVLIQFR